MFRFFKYILLVLALCIAFGGCSKVNKPNRVIPSVQNKSVVKASENIVEVISLNKIPPLKEGTKFEINWAFPYVRYNREVYEIVLEKVVEKAKVGEEIGKIERFLSSIVLSDGSFSDKDGDSNYIAKGSLIYSFEGKDVREAIIIDDKGIFREAVLHSN